MKNSNNNKSFLYWSIAAFFCLYEVILRVSPCGITCTLMNDFCLTCTELGFLIGAYYWAYAFLQIPCGFLADKIGSRKVVFASALICCIGTLLFALTSNFYIALLGRMLIGIGSASGFITALKVAADWFPKRLFSLFASLTNMMSTFGGNFGGKPLTILMDKHGWQNIYYLLSAIGLIIALLAVFVMKDKQLKEKLSFQSTKTEFYTIIKDTQIWLAGIIGGICYLPITALAELWGTPFLASVFNITDEKASISTNLIFIGTAIGSPFFAFLAKKIKTYKIPLYIVSIASLICLTIFTFSTYFSLNTALVTLFILGLAIGGQILVFSIVKERVSNAISGTALGFTNTLISMFGIVFQPLLGLLLDVFWQGSASATGIRIYSPETYQKTMFILPLIAILASFLIRKIEEK